MILKVNQIGTVSESLVAADLAKENDWNIVTSHRSGETIDTFIADFAAGIGSQFIKSGAPARGERVAKYNRILEIEEELNI
jgi:enolase